MDDGHHNCRDYYITPHSFSPAAILNERNLSVPSATEHPSHPLCHRHESFDQLEQRSRSPASQKPKFPLLKLPVELRAQVFGYLLPHTQEVRGGGGNTSLSEHARNFGAVRKRMGWTGKAITGASGCPPAAKQTTKPTWAAASNVVWKRGNMSLLGVCRQLHQECAEMIYGSNTFLLFVTFSGVSFRFRWLLPSGLAPSRTYDFLALLPQRYMRLVKKVVVHVDLVDSHTGMVKFNVHGKGLTHGLRKQISRLVDALREADNDGEEHREKRMARVNLKVSNAQASDQSVKGKESASKKRDGGVTTSKGLEEMLEPFEALHGVREVTVEGAVTDSFAQLLSDKMQSEVLAGSARPGRESRDSTPVMCVYGNDI